MADANIPNEETPVLNPDRSKNEINPVPPAVQTVSQLNERVIRSIHQADQAGAINPQQAQQLQQERAGCLTLALSAISKVVPTRFKARLYENLQGHDLDRAYIMSLNPQTQKRELDRMKELYEDQIVYLSFRAKTPQAANLRAERTIDGLLTIIDRRGGLDEPAIESIRRVIYSLSERNTSSNIDLNTRARLAEKLVRFGLKDGSSTQRKDLLIEYSRNFNDSSALLDCIAPSERAEVIQGILEKTQWNWSNFLNGITKAKSLLSYAPPTSRPALLVHLGKQWRLGMSPEEQVAGISAITSDPLEQDIIFWEVCRPHYDYRNSGHFDIDAVVARAEPDPNHTMFVTRQMRQGFLSPDSAAAYGGKIINQKLAADTIDVKEVSYLANLYGVNLSPYRDRLVTELETAFRTGSLSRELATIARQIDSVTFATGSEPFNMDMFASPELGERTWRKEQSIIDTLQNHLDANDFRYAYNLIAAAFGEETAAQSLARGEVGVLGARLWTFKERYPIPEAERWRYEVYSFEGSEEELIGKLAAVGRVKPAIQVLIADSDHGEIWIEHDRINEYPNSVDIKGVKFTDAGFGFDEQLGAKFIPTKSKIDFLRGSFGQGAKMSMIALLREGCQVKLASAYVDPETGERIEWTGQPQISAQTGTVEFGGERRRVFSTEHLNSTGSTTEILFDKANSVAKRVFQSMLDTRTGEGIGRYVLDYQEPNTYQYGGFGSEIQISADPAQGGRVYVQGLEVPALNTSGLGLGYNFPSTEYLTGADRRYLEMKKVDEGLEDTWRGVKDPTLLKGFYNLVLGRTNILEPKESTTLKRFGLLSDDVREIHKKVLEESLGLDETHQKAVLASKYDLSREDVVDKLRKAGFSVVEGFYRIELASLGWNILGRNAIYDIPEALREIDQGSSTSVEIPEQLQVQFTTLLSKAKSGVQDTLLEHGLTEEIARLNQSQIEIEARAQQNTEKGTWVERIPICDNSLRLTGYKIIIYPNRMTETAQLPETISEEDAAFLQFLMEMELLTLTTPGQHGWERKATKLIFGQDIANRLIEAAAVHGYPGSAEARAITIKSEPMDLSIHSADKIIEHDEQVLKMDQTTAAVSAYDATLDESRKNLDIINAYLAHPDIAGARASVKELCGKQYFEVGKLYEIAALKTEDPNELRLGIQEVPCQTLGVKNGYTVLLAGERESSRIIIPIDLTNAHTVTLRDGKSEAIVSKYKDSQHSTNWARDVFPENPVRIFEDDWGGGYVTKAIIDNNIISFPIGAFDERTIQARVQHFLQAYPLEVEIAGAIVSTESNTGQTYLESSASIDYGQGPSWDDPRRIFGDIAQNHLDETGKAGLSIAYQVRMGDERRWVSEESLRQPEYSTASLVGISFEDQGGGFNTKQLLVWGESGKRTGGKRGKFGTGMKLLTASCVRNGFDLVLKSRLWEAKPKATEERPVIAHGRRIMKQMVGFGMKWNDNPRTGSVTQLTVPDELEGRTKEVWQEWSDVFDPRKQDILGHRGLERYVRALRTEKGRTVKIGPVTILLDETGLYEGGIVIPEAETRLERKLLFGYDIDGDIVATQERNVADQKKLNAYIAKALKEAPVEVCERILQEVRYQTSPAEQKTEIMEAHLTGRQARDPKAQYSEFELINPQIEPLRLAYYNVYGKNALLSSAASAKHYLEQGSKDGKPLTEEQQALFRSVIANEEHNFPPASLIRMDNNRYSTIRSKLEGHVPTTQEHTESLSQQPRIITDEETAELRKVVQSTAQGMLGTLQALYESPKGKAVLERLMLVGDREIRLDEKVRQPLRASLRLYHKTISESEAPLEEVMYFLEAVAREVLPIELQVKNAAMGAEGYAFGLNGIAYADRIFADPANTVATTTHELLHLASQTRDYNTTFTGLLMLMNPNIARRYTSSLS